MSPERGSSSASSVPNKSVTRRAILHGAGLLGAMSFAGLGCGTAGAAAPATSNPVAGKPRNDWPGGARLVISVSMQFEAGAQPESGAGGPFPPIDPRYPDLPVTKWYDYGVKEGIPRLLDLWDRHGIKVTSHMVGQAVERSPALARQIVERGHEAAGHGQTWTPQFSMTPAEERASYEASIRTIEKATGTRPLGFNAFWLRGTLHTLEILQDLGFLYHIDDVSRDEPFLIPVRGKPFVVVPYTLRNNDIVRYDSPALSTEAFVSDLKADFDVLYAEAEGRRRMMSISTHDRISGTPARVKALGDFFTYAQRHPGVVFLRKDAIARFALESANTLREGV